MRTRILQLALVSVALAAASPSIAAPRPILDYRKESPDRPPTVPAQTRAVLAKAMAETAGAKTVVVLGHVRGQFSAAGGSEDLYLVADKGPVAAQPFPDGPGQLLVAIRDGRSVVYKLPAETRYQRIAGTVDSDRDGRGEVLLETASYTMGQSVTSVDLVGLGADGAATVRQSLKEVAYDGCDNPAGKREKSASTVVLEADGRLVATPYGQRCR